MDTIQWRYSNRWIHHAIAGPIIGVIGTYICARLFGNGEWLFWENMAAIQEAGFYGALLYPAFSALYEASMLIWRRGYLVGHTDSYAEHQSTAIQNGRDEGKATALTVVWRLAGTDEQKDLVRAAASDLDINLPAVLGQPYMTARLSVLSPWDVLWKRFADASSKLRQLLGIDAFNGEFDKMLRQAASVALDDLVKQVNRLHDRGPESADAGVSGRHSPR